MTSAIGRAPPPVPENRLPPRAPPPKIAANNSDNEQLDLGGSNLPGSGSSDMLPPMKSAPGLPPAPSGPPKAPPQALFQGGPSPDPVNTASPFTPEQIDIMEKGKLDGRTSVMLDGYGKVKLAQDAFAFTKKEEKRSKWGAMAWYMGMDCVTAGIFLGMVAMLLGSASDKKDKWGGADIFAGIYSFFGAFPLAYWEYYYGKSRVQRTWPMKAVIYFLACIIPWISFGTHVLAMYLLLCSIANLLAWREGEEYEERKKRKKKKDEPEYQMSYSDQFRAFIHTVIYQGDGKMYLFVLFWFLLNFIVLVERWDFYFKDIQDKNDANIARLEGLGLEGKKVMSPFYLGMAKGFGTLLDINMTIILLPVCRTMIRFLYNISTTSTVYGNCLNWIFSFTPLDKNLEFHKLLAGFVYVSAWLHTLAHFMNFANYHATYDDVFGDGIWVTGVLLLLIIHLLYCSAFNEIRFGKFELFWYNHHLFILFFFFTLIHGDGMWNPNFWKYLLVPGILYAIERGFREYRSRENFGVVSVTHMESMMEGKKSRVFALELEKRGAMSSFRQGQYVFLKCPYVSGFQWHPFTIASAPEAKTFTCIIRNQGDGSWTGKVQEYLQAMSPGKQHYNLTHRDPSGKMVPQYIGPDGTQLFQVDGPYAAPTQHIGTYKVGVVVAAGIGVTPLRATMQSIVHHKWRFASGEVYPSHARFHWQLRWSDLATFAFMMRTIKDVEDDFADQKFKAPDDAKKRSLEIHIWLSRVPKDVDTKEFVTPGIDATKELSKAVLPTGGFKRKGLPSVGTQQNKQKSQKKKLNKMQDKTTTEMFGPQADIALTANKSDETQGVQYHTSDMTEMDLYRACWNGKDVHLPNSHTWIHAGYPKWPSVFEKLSREQSGERIGVMFCGPPAIGETLKENCGRFSDYNGDSGGTIFKLHMENF